MLAMVTTTVHDDYFMFIKMGFKMPVSPTDRDAVSKAELELRRQAKAIELFRKYMPGCEKAFIARTSPTLNIRRARVIACDYDIARADVLEGRHFDDDVMAYGFHDTAPRLQIKNGGTYGIPYKALRVAGLENLLAAGMLITSNHDAHMSTQHGLLHGPGPGRRQRRRPVRGEILRHTRPVLRHPPRRLAEGRRSSRKLIRV